MKMLNKTDFLDLPSGVLYSIRNENHSDIDEELFIKYASPQNIHYNPLININWIEQNLINAPLLLNHNEIDKKNCLDEALSTETSFELDYTHKVPNNLYNDFQQFAVYEKKDVQRLIGFLNQTLSTYPTLDKGESL